MRKPTEPLAPMMTTAELLSDAERLLTVAELALILRVARGTIDNWHSAGIDLPPSLVVGRRQLRFRAADVSAWLHRRRSAGDATSEGRAA